MISSLINKIRQKAEDCLRGVKNRVRQKIEHYLGGGSENMEELPRKAFWLVYFMTLSVLIQGILDLVIKFAGYTPFMVMFPWRVDFLFLTGISVLMGYQTLKGIEGRKLEVTRNSVEVGLLVEVALVVGDVLFIIQHQDTIPEALWVRSPFIFFTIINIGILLYLIQKLHLFRDPKGKVQIL